MTDERDPKLSQAYRELGREEPPRALDEAILAAAHRAERTHPAPLLSPGVGRPARERWTFPLAAAAVIMLAVGVVVHLQREQPGIDGVQVSADRAPAAPAPAPVAEASKPVPQPEAPKPEETMVARVPAAREAPAQLTRREASGAAAGPVAPAAPAAAASAPAPMAMQGVEEVRRDRAGTAERQVLSAATAKRSQDAVETPEKWLERIAELRRAGKHEEADKALAEFRQRHPGYRIPEAMLEKVERKEK